MVKITKNGKRMEVPSAAFQSFYKNAGWSLEDRCSEQDDPLDEVSGLLEDDPEYDGPEEPDDSEWDEAIAEEEPEMPDGVEKPVAKMNRDELLKKAESMGIDVSGNPSNNKIREMIRKHA